MFTFLLHVELVILLKYGIKRFPLNHLPSELNIPGVIYLDTNIGWFIRQNLET